MAAKNDITGDKIVSKTQNKKYDDGYDRIFKKRPKEIFVICKCKRVCYKSEEICPFCGADLDG